MNVGHGQMILVIPKSCGSGLDFFLAQAFTHHRNKLLIVVSTPWQDYANGGAMRSQRLIGPKVRVSLGIALIVVTVIPVVTIGLASPASAQTCGHSSGIEAYSIAWYCGTSSDLEGQWHDNNMYLSTADYAADGHVTNEMWALTNIGWLETGLLSSGNIWGANPCKCNAYQQFWADDNGNFYFHWLTNISPDGHNHVYELLNFGTTYWYVYLDYGYVGTSTIQTTTTSYQTQVGLELYTGLGRPYVDSSSHSDTFTNIIADYYGSWFYPPWTAAYVDNGCNVYPLGVCLNGATGGSGVFSDNKP
jgi:hypothetical protein